ncbi:hypothetical protein J6590_061250 [Homalodisca vitripennis]|nr:hypothetical protein J6590_061250 [Homalodisca vitripennis]
MMPDISSPLPPPIQNYVAAMQFTILVLVCDSTLRYAHPCFYELPCVSVPLVSE